MKLQQANKQFRQHYPHAFDSIKEHLPAGLRSVLSLGLTEVGNCIFLNALLSKAHVKREDFPDDTGYECFVNMIHIDNFVDEEEMMTAAISFLSEVSKALERYSDRCFQGIIARDEDTCVVRFHTIRAGEKWLSDDLDAYEECVAIVEM